MGVADRGAETQDSVDDPKLSDEEEESDDDDDDESDGETGEYVNMLRNVDSLDALMQKLEEKDSDDSYPPLKGNLYRLLFINRAGFMQDKIAFLGFISVICVQLCAPFAIIFWACFQINWAESTLRPLTYRAWEEERGVSHVMKVLLAVAFLLCYALNGLSVVKQDHEMHMKLNMLVRYADPDKEKVRKIQDHLHYHWSALGVFITATMPIVSNVGLFLLFIISEGPKDVVFDSLGMTFLYTLDDIDGPLGLLSTKDWDEDRMGRFYFKMVNPEICTPKRPNLANTVHRSKKFRKKFGSPLFMFAAWAMRLLAFVLPCAFFFTDGIVVLPQCG